RAVQEYSAETLIEVRRCAGHEKAERFPRQKRLAHSQDVGRRLICFLDDPARISDEITVGSEIKKVSVTSVGYLGGLQRPVQPARIRMNPLCREFTFHWLVHIPLGRSLRVRRR